MNAPITMDIVSEDIETLARHLVSDNGGDPNLQVQLGEPQIYAAPGGVAFAVFPAAVQPLWRLYVPAAKRAMAAARRVIDVETNKKDIGYSVTL